MNRFLRLIRFLWLLMLCLLAAAALGAAVLLVRRQLEAGRDQAEAGRRPGDCHNRQLPYRDPALPVEIRVADLLGRMTTEEKIGQLALVEKNSLKHPGDIRRYHLGALLSGGGANPAVNTPAGWRDMVEGFAAYGRQDCLEIPLLYGVDAVHGFGGLPTATLFPQAIGLGAADDPDLVRRVGAATAEELGAVGIFWNFFPSLDVAQDTRWGRTYETFGADPARVARLGVAYLEGFQSVRTEGVRPLATLKHYVGLGAMVWGSSDTPGYVMDHGDTVLPEATLRAEHLLPFQAAVRQGAGCVMTGLNRWNGEKLSGHRYLVTEVLKEESDFGGFVVSDWLGASGLAEDECASWLRGIDAGLDMVMLPFEYEKFTSCLQTAVRRGTLSRARLDDAAGRILGVKFAMGLFDRRDSAADFSAIGSAEHRLLAREAVRKSLVLLQDEGKILPLDKQAPRVLVAGSAADNLGRQAGGWTVEWQGVEGNDLAGTTILSGIRQAVAPQTRVEYDRAGNFTAAAEPAELGIAVVGEASYAEGWGDAAHPALSAEDLAAIRKVRAFSRKLVVVIVSGRPLDLGASVRAGDAVVAAWLPGSEGAGVADVLFGDYPFSGTLPVGWPL